MQIGIASAKPAREPVPAALGNRLAVSDHFKLTGTARGNHGCNAEVLLYEGHETRDLGFVVLSGRAGNYLDLHSVLHWAGVRQCATPRSFSHCNRGALSMSEIGIFR